ncbi:MAG: hypothetical protein ACKODB_02290 [Betaproteobacteria bacterium]|jgi:regulator of replication initiation timing
MEQDLQLLDDQIGQLLANVSRLIDENARLKAALANTQAVNAELRDRMTDARTRVELALARLPAEWPDSA